MNKKIKKYKSKYKTLVERLTKPRTITIGPRHYMGLAACALAAIMGAYTTGDYLVRKYCEMEQMKQEQRIEQEQEQRIDRLTDEDREVFEYFKKGFKITTGKVKNQEGESVRMTDLIKRSMEGKEAKKYAESLVQEAYDKNKGKKFDTLESTIQLAKGIIDNARVYLQKKVRRGQSTYSRAYEYQKDFTSQELLAMEEEIDETKCAEDQEECLEYRQMLKDILEIGGSTQTFDQFFGPKDGRILAGDCDDFSIALTTTYHALKEYAEENKDKDDFYKALVKGLNHYRIYSIGIRNNPETEKHMLNLSAAIRDVPYFQVIEPQNKSKKHDIDFRGAECKIVPDKKRNGAHGVFVRYEEGENDVEEEMIKIFNKDFYANSKE